MAVEILEFECCHLFVAVNPLVAMMVARAVGGYLGIVVPKETVSGLRVVVVKPVVHTTKIVGTLDGEEPYPGSVLKGVLGINENIAICHLSYRIIPNKS